VTVEEANAVPVRVGVVSFVTPSEADAPVSPGIPVMTGAAGTPNFRTSASKPLVIPTA
jgi:hypothetical protein